MTQPFVFARRDLMLAGRDLGERVGHVVMAEEESIDIEDRYTLWLAEKLLQSRDELDALDNRRLHWGY